jgi:hypothetical protein
MRTAPLTATAFLWAVACVILVGACSGDDDDQPSDISVEALCQAWCEQQEECQPEAFQQNHGSMDNCRSSCELDAGDFYDGYPNPECVDEALIKDLCVANLSCQQLAEMDYESCQDEFDALQVCLGHTDGGI